MVRLQNVLQLQKTKIFCCASDAISSNFVRKKPQRHGNERGRGAQEWIDSLRVYVKGGHGGNGHPKYGGIGGKGGDVIIQTSQTNTEQSDLSKKRQKKEKESNKSLYDVFKREFHKDSGKQNAKGGPGEDAERVRLIGKNGYEKILQVPTGVSIHIDERGSRKFLGNLDVVGDKVVVAHGGAGGGPGNGWIGQPGESLHIRLDLRLIADLGLVGFPNAGKSTLLKAISKANPKIASYPFTTIKPNLGHIYFEDEREITMADLPGLIEGAHINLGLGHKFLKHVERTLCNIFVVDIQGFQLNAYSLQRNAFETIALLNKELEMYNPDLLERPSICLVNKMDTANSNEKFDDLVNKWCDNESNYEEGLLSIDEEMWPQKKINFREIIPISAKHSPKTVQYVKDRIRQHLDAIDDEKKKYNEKIQNLSDELDIANVDSGPRVA